MPNSIPSGEEILSQDFDTQPSVLDASSVDLSASDRKLLESWQYIGNCLRQIPVASMDLTSTVRHQCASSVSAKLNRVPATQQPVCAQHRHFRTTAVLAAVASVVLVAAMVLTSDQGLNRDSGVVASHRRATVLPSMNYYGDPATWDVVLVTVPDGNDRQVVQQLRQSFAENGVLVHSADSDSTVPDYEDVQQVRSGAVSGELFEVLTGGKIDVETQWNPEQIDDQGRDELLARFAESMKTPSRSDEHFGEMVVVFSQETMDAIEVAVGSGKVASGSMAHAASRSESEPLSASSSTAVREDTNRQGEFDASSSVRIPRPVLVVVRKRKMVAPAAEPHAGQHGVLPNLLDWVLIAKSVNDGRFA